MNYKKLIPFVSIPIVAVLGIGISLAYFTDREVKESVFVTGNVKISLEEPNYKYLNSQDLVPGSSVKKDPTIIVKAGSENCYIRTRINYEGLNEAQIKELEEKINFYSDWVKSEEEEHVWYFQDIVDKQQSDQRFTIFDTVTIPSYWENEFEDRSFKISVIGEAVQADYLTVLRNDNKQVVGWQNTRM